MRPLKLARAAVGIDTVAVDMALHGFPICGPSFLGHSPLDFKTFASPLKLRERLYRDVYWARGSGCYVYASPR